MISSGRKEWNISLNWKAKIITKLWLNWKIKINKCLKYHDLYDNNGI
jgi:hypothetical protein